MNDILWLILYFWVSCGISGIFYPLFTNDVLSKTTFDQWEEFKVIDLLQFPVMVLHLVLIIFGTIIGPIIWLVIYDFTKEKLNGIKEKEDEVLTTPNRYIKRTHTKA